MSVETFFFGTIFTGISDAPLPFRPSTRPPTPHPGSSSGSLSHTTLRPWSWIHRPEKGKRVHVAYPPGGRCCVCCDVLCALLSVDLVGGDQSSTQKGREGETSAIESHLPPSPLFPRHPLPVDIRARALCSRSLQKPSFIILKQKYTLYKTVQKM